MLPPSSGWPVRARSLVFWLVILAIVAAIAHGSGTFEPVRAPRDPDTPISGRARVIDGDSLEVGRERIRLHGIDAPEGRQRCRDANGDDYACGRDARRALAALIDSRPVTCRMVTHDQYARDVAICMVDGRDLGDAMVRAGHARDYARHSGGRYAAAEREARAARRGLWAGKFEEPVAWRRGR